ncbi:Carboxylesterase NlhH [Rubripirellula lacrimiformis]|uniref:Carboxylesterase NlhH n=1 Tax=Rubripirellula lacrimiformis TaxID=1930273 RepID=A0A517N547_9BACT|nr:alpha/beta hydrolase [Rubripirellula lacrimiformis]QDT02231.1 Carboxylesterase NlhH [Rubripirellula lacrimiformis]
MPLHPQAQAFADMVAQQDSAGWEDQRPEEARIAFAGMTERFGDAPDLARVEDHDAGDGVRIRVYGHDADSPSAAVVFFHGGGWVLGNLESHDAVCRRLAAFSKCTVVAVDYRLAPENPFPGPVDDCYAALKHIVDHCDALSIDPNRIAVAGDSAGANLAIAVAMKARDEDGPTLQFQLLLYPVIEPKFETQTYVQFAQGYGLTRATMQYFWQQYLGAAPGESPASKMPLAVPSKAISLAGLPPTHVVTAEYDVLRDEGESFARLLSDDGVPTTLRRYDGMLHGFIHFAGLFDTGVLATEDVATILRKKLH